MPLLDNSFTGVTPNVYLNNKPVDLIAPPIKPFNIELTKEFATKTQIPDNYKRAFESLQSETKSQFIPTGDTFSTKDSNVYGVQGLNFTPGVDNEGIAYLKQDNALSKGVSGMFDVAKASFFSQINTIPNLFSSIVSGEDLFRDNEQNRHLAESLRKLEEDNNKIFKSADQRENPLAPHNIFSKENFSSLLQQTGITVGTIGGIILENLALKVAEAGLVSTGGGVPAAVALEGAEDIRAAIGISKTLGTTGKAIKDILTGVSTLTKSYAAAKGISQAGQMVKALNLTELGVRAFLHANGEAALQKHIAREDIIKSLVDQEGNNLTQEKLDQIHSIAEQGSNTEYYLNLPLLMVSDMYQFGNVLMGKQLNNVLDKFPVSAKLTGGALEFSGKAPSFGRYLTNKTLDFILKSQTEGLEEIAQYGIENFTRDYYKDLYNKKTTSTAYNFMKYLGKGAESMFNEEGLSQYISGVLIGGITNVGLGAVTSVPQIAANPKRFFTPYSSYKETIENAFSRNNTLGENTLKYFSSVAKQNDAFQQGDKAKFNDELAKQIFDFTDTSLKRGTFGHIIDTIKSWSTLENEQFNASGFAGMGENLNPDQQRTYVNSLLDKINLAKEAVENTQRVFKVNPFEKENWFVEKIKNRGKTDEEILSQDLFKAQSSHIFNQLRNVAAYLTFKKENQSTRFEGLTSELNNEFNPKFVENMLGEKPSVKNYLLDQLKQFEQELAIYEEGVDPKSINSIEGVRDRKNTLKKLIDSINSVKDKPEEELVKVMSLPEEVKGIITNAEMSIEDFNKASEKLIDSYKLKQSINTLNKIYKSWGTIEGQKELINSVLDHSVYSPTETSNPQVTPKTETPETTVPKQEMSLADMLSSMPLADVTEYSVESTEPYYVDDEDMSFPIEEYSSPQQISHPVALQNKQESKNISSQITIEAKKADIERRKQALRDLMKATGVDIFMLGVEDGTFMGEALLNMNENGDVVLTRYADSEEGLTKGKGKTKNLKDIAGQFGGEQIATSGVEGGLASFASGVVGEYHIPLQELIDLIKSEDVVFAGLGNKEFVLSPHIADKYLAKINGKEINAKYDAEIEALKVKESGSVGVGENVITPNGFTNRVFESNIQLGEAPNDAHISEEGYNYRVLSQNEIDAISESGGVFAREGKQKGGNKNTKYWTKGNNKNWYGDKDGLETIRVKQDNFKENEVVRAENVEVYNRKTKQFEPLIKEQSLKETTKAEATTSNQAEIEAKKADIERINEAKDLHTHLFRDFTTNNLHKKLVKESLSANSLEQEKNKWNTEKEAQKAIDDEIESVSEKIEYWINKGLSADEIIKKIMPPLTYVGNPLRFMVANGKQRIINFIKAKVNGEVNFTLQEAHKTSDAEINAKYDAELKVLEEQPTPTTSNQSEIEAKKADIEKRRQEELNNPKEGLTKKDAIIEAQKDLGNLDTKEKRDRNKDRIEALKQFINLLSNSNSIEEAHDKFKDSFTETTPVTNRIAELFNAIFGAKNNINAKYDAELAALENTKPVSDKKADIERRRQEELNVFPNSEVEEIVYHNTTTDFEEFKQGKDGAIHFGDKEAARQRTKNVVGEKFTKEAKINIKNLVEGVDSLDFDPPVNATKEEKQIYFELLKKADNETKEHIIALYKNGKLPLEQANKLIDENWSLEKIYKELFNADGYYYINQAENKGSKSYVVFNPNQIKIVIKINARYDAELAALENKDLKDNKNLNTIESVINQIKDCKS